MRHAMVYPIEVLNYTLRFILPIMLALYIWLVVNFSLLLQLFVIHVQSKDEIRAKKEEAMQPYILRSSEEMECGTETFYNPPIMFPTRPKWDHSLSRTKLEQQEQRYFQVLLCVEIWASLKSFPQCISLEFPSKIYENSSQKVH